MIARAAGNLAVMGLLATLALWALVTADDAEAALRRCPLPPLHGPDVTCVCLRTLNPPRHECWACTEAP